MKPAGDNVTKAPTGYITVNDRPMAFWLPDGMEPEDIGLMDDSGDPGPDADDSVNDLVDVPDAQWASEGAKGVQR